MRPRKNIRESIQDFAKNLFLESINEVTADESDVCCNSKTYNLALSLLDSLGVHQSPNEIDFDRSDGSIVFIWWEATNNLQINILDDSISYRNVDGAHVKCGRDLIRNNQFPSNVLDLIDLYAK